MPAKVPIVERRSRIVCHFPMNRAPESLRPNQMRVIHEFINFLKKTTLTQLCPAHFVRCRDVYVEFLWQLLFCGGLARHQLYYLLRT